MLSFTDSRCASLYYRRGGLNVYLHVQGDVAHTRLAKRRVNRPSQEIIKRSMAGVRFELTRNTPPVLEAGALNRSATLPWSKRDRYFAGEVASGMLKWDAEV